MVMDSASKRGKQHPWFFVVGQKQHMQNFELASVACA